MKDKKKRLDIALVEQGIVESREKGKNLISAGLIFINGNMAGKSSDMVLESDVLTLKGKGQKHVSRGGLKLEKAVELFDIELFSKVCMDIGAATGGFTDCMLQNGAAKVYCVDVGYGQLAWSLREDERVVNLERQNIRHITDAEVPEKIDFISVDVSFISLSHIFPVAFNLLKEDGTLVCLIKPQFETTREKVGKKGVVREKRTHEEVIEKIVNLAKSSGFHTLALTFSPVKGPEGNIEFLLYLSKKNAESIDINKDMISFIVLDAHGKL